MDKKNKGEVENMRSNFMSFKYKVIEYTYNKDGIRICKTCHLTNSKLKYILIIIILELKNKEYEVI